MTPEERDLVNHLFQRLKSADRAQSDREAEQRISELVAEQPAAPYLLTQLVLVQEHALGNANARIAQLEAERAAAQREEPAAGGKSGFLGGLAESGPWGARESAAAAPAAAQAAGPSAPRATTGSVPVTAAPVGGGFLHQALATAAGVAGGALLLDGIRSLFAHNPGPFGPALGAGWAQPAGARPDTTIVDNDYGNDRGGDASSGDPGMGDSSGVVDAGDSRDGGFAPDDQGSLQDADLGGDGGDFDGGGTDFGSGDDPSFT